MGKFDFALPRPLKIELDIPGYDAKRAAKRIHAREANERDRFKRQHSASAGTKPPAAPVKQPAPPPTPEAEVHELQASLRRQPHPCEPDLSEALMLPKQVTRNNKVGRK